MFLYDVKEIGSDEVVRKVRKSSKYIGDDRRKLGELAFVSRDRLAVQLRSREALAPLHSLESDEACHPLFPSDVDINNDVLFSPKVMNLWPDENPLWQCPGYFVESEETHTYGRIAAKSLSLLDDRCKYWDAPPEESAEMWQECAKAQAVAYDVQSECFWVRSGFMFLYDVKEIGSDEVVRKVRKSSKYIGDDRRKLGELAFVSRDRLAVQLRSREALAPLHSLESDEACHPLFPSDVDINNDVLFSPKVMNLWPDENPLWQCPGYFVESEETHTYGRIGAKSLSLLDDRCKYWDAPPEESAEMWQECAKAQAVASLFTMLCAQAHTHGKVSPSTLT
ncbi:hypothetical protein ANCDUO_07659 [Ancylostoma duodenale]|uniref:Uncharacterized protein n=1 Tax=Ancylostoma duodenale TaxID=51022 RepID=A0A0C2GST2_9BILA|nr:hypothetical protein ANCDUO_07659 [Ancylostoma duodenale]